MALKKWAKLNRPGCRLPTAHYIADPTEPISLFPLHAEHCSSIVPRIHFQMGNFSETNNGSL